MLKKIFYFFIGLGLLIGLVFSSIFVIGMYTTDAPCAYAGGFFTASVIFLIPTAIGFIIGSIITFTAGGIMYSVKEHKKKEQYKNQVDIKENGGA